MLEIRDKTFDIRYFKKIIEVLDGIYIAQKLSDKDPIYYVMYAGKNAEGYLHQVALYNRKSNKGFELFLYENQALKYKGFIRIKIKDIEFNAKKNAHVLKKMGFEKWNIRKKGISTIYCIYLDKPEEQILSLVTCYSEYLL